MARPQDSEHYQLHQPPQSPQQVTGVGVNGGGAGARLSAEREPLTSAAGLGGSREENADDGMVENEKEPGNEVADVIVVGAEAANEAVKQGDGRKDDKRKASKPSPVPYLALFRHADSTDVLLMLLGSLGAVLHGAAQPLSFLYLGKLVDSFGSQDMTNVDTYVLSFVYIAMVCLVGGWLEVSCWMHTGERQSARVRVFYLRALLRQEVAFFDLEASSGELVNRVASDVLLLQDAISEKVGNFLHYLTTFVCGFIVGFTALWQMALVILAVCPAIVAVGGLYAVTLTGLASRGEEAYLDAGKIAEQVVSSLYNPDIPAMRSDVNRSAVILAALGALCLPIHTMQNFGFGVAGESLVRRVRVAMLSAVLRNEVAWFDREGNSSGAVAGRLAADATLVKAAVADRISLAAQNASVVVIAFALGFALEWRMALVVLATFPLLILAASMEQQFLSGFAGNQSKAHARATTVAAEAVSNIRTVAAFGAEDKVMTLFTASLAAPLRRSFIRGQIGGAGFGLSQFFMYSSYALALWYGSTLIPDVSSYSSVLKSFFVLIMTSMAIAESISLAPDIAKGSIAVRSVFHTTDRTPKILSDDPTAPVLTTVRGEVDMRKVSFAYPMRPEVAVLKDFSLHAAPGQVVALVGPSGSGKSSVIALLERFYDPTSGSVMLDGVDIQTVQLKSLRGFIGLVSQEPALFATSIRNNILYGRESAGEAEVVEAAKAANVHTFISSLPMGYDTEVGERGAQLSGGQKQRIAIARAILKDPAVLLLDEATSALDAESEGVVQSALHRVMIGRTTIVVAHRLSTIRHADNIAVLQNGALVEQGTHDELMANPEGAYATLVQLQQRNKVAL